MDGLAGVEFIQGDFTETEVLERLLAALGERRADLVISDMGRNMSGMDAVDQPKAIYLVELALELAHEVLKPAGGFVAKVFHGEGFDSLLKDVRSAFAQVAVRSEEHTSELQSRGHLVCRLLLEK